MVYPTYAQARKILWKSLTSEGERFLDYLPKEAIANINSQEMCITLINKSIIQLLGSDNYDSLVGTNASGIVFSEYALQDPNAYRFLSPALKYNAGFAIFISCVAPNTLVIGKNGLQKISAISNRRETYSDLNIPIYGLGGFHNAEQFYYGDKQKTLIITLDSGYKLECTPIHPIWNGKEWIQSQDLSVGDLIPVQYGQEIWPDSLNFDDFFYKRHGLSKESIISNNEDFFYLLGLIHADGNYNENAVTITKKKDPEIISFVNGYGFKTRKDGIHHELSHKEFCAFLEWIGFKHGARSKEFPDKLLKSSRKQMRAFIQGIFDGDGTSNSSAKKNGRIKLTSTNLSFLQTIQIILLNFGICSSIRKEEKAPTKRVKVWSTIYNLEIFSYFAYQFYEQIGFRLERKQANKQFVKESVKQESGNIYPIDLNKLSNYVLPKSIVSNPHRISRRLISQLQAKRPYPYLEELLSEKFYYSPIKSIETSENEVFDFVIPETHSFFSNGFISHNTPRGRNHCYELFEIAKANPKVWYSQLLTIEDTQHISIEEIEDEVKRGEISVDLAQQEYWCSFSRGVEGSYYAKYIDEMRRKGQIGQVPWENELKVHTAWDIGNDCTSIIFFQTPGQIIRIIDYYENSGTGYGLEHYAKIILSKPYLYGRHIFPHDMINTEWGGTRLTRLEKARQLGLTNGIICEKRDIDDGIEVVRSAFARMWIDETNCSRLIKALENYRQEFDPKRNTYKGIPLHDWASHPADAMRYLCLSVSKTRATTSPEELEKRYQDAMYGSNGNLTQTAAIFRDDLPNY